MLKDDIARYTELSGEDGEHTSIQKIGSYLDGYDRAIRWIPVTERLPEEGITVLTYDEQEDIEFGEYQDGKWYWLAESCADYWTKNSGVLAWMPLPEPYKGGDTE